MDWDSAGTWIVSGVLASALIFLGSSPLGAAFGAVGGGLIIGWIRRS